MANLSAEAEDLKVNIKAMNTYSEVETVTVAQNSDLPPPYTVSETVEPGQPITNRPVVLQTIIVPLVLRKTPVYVNCPQCNERTMTTVQYVNRPKTHMIAGFICGLTFCCMLCCLSAIPYVINTFKTAEHYCSHCNTFIGSCS